VDAVHVRATELDVTVPAARLVGWVGASVTGVDEELPDPQPVSMVAAAMKMIADAFKKLMRAFRIPV
jgi:hypothetical protein